jgi:hypothetical protein
METGLEKEECGRIVPKAVGRDSAALCREKSCRTLKTGSRNSVLIYFKLSAQRGTICTLPHVGRIICRLRNAGGARRRILATLEIRLQYDKRFDSRPKQGSRTSPTLETLRLALRYYRSFSMIGCDPHSMTQPRSHLRRRPVHIPPNL